VTPELHRPVAVERIGRNGLDCVVEASPTECAALATRMGVPAVLALTCRFDLAPGPNDTIAARGRLNARLVQCCVITLDDFETTVVEDFTIRFVPQGAESDELDPEAEDEIPFRDGVLDLGEAAAEQLALALDPYPRRPGAALPEQEPAEPEAGLARLGALRARH
jgi:uncharacterized metal-binding protein YceD (DUF177 family)